MKKSLVSLASLATLLLIGSNVSAQGIPWAYSATSPPDTAATTSPASYITFTGSAGNPNGNSGIIIAHSAFPQPGGPYPNEGHEIQVCNLGNGSFEQMGSGGTSGG